VNVLINLARQWSVTLTILAQIALTLIRIIDSLRPDHYFHNCTGFHANASTPDRYFHNSIGFHADASTPDRYFHNSIGFHADASTPDRYFRNCIGFHADASTPDRYFRNCTGFHADASTPDRYFHNCTGFHTDALTPDRYFHNCTGFHDNASSTRQRCWCVEWTRPVSRSTSRNTLFNASHLVRPAQLHYCYCQFRDWPLISQNVHSPTLYHLEQSRPTEVMLCDSEHSFERHLKTFLFISCHQTVWLMPHQCLCSLL